MTPPHSAGIYYLFGFFLFGIFFASSGSRRRPLPCRLPFAACLPLPSCALLFCVRAVVGVGVIGIRAAHKQRPPAVPMQPGVTSAPRRESGDRVSPRRALVRSCMCGPCVVLVCTPYVTFLCVPPSGLRIAVDFRVNIS